MPMQARAKLDINNNQESHLDGTLNAYKRFFCSAEMVLIGYLVQRDDNDLWGNQKYSYQNLSGSRYSPQRGFTREVYFHSTYPAFTNSLIGGKKIEVYGLSLINGCPDQIKRELLARYDIDKAVYMELKEMERNLVSSASFPC